MANVVAYMHSADRVELRAIFGGLYLLEFKASDGISLVGAFLDGEMLEKVQKELVKFNQEGETTPVLDEMVEEKLDPREPWADRVNEDGEVNDECPW